MTRSDAQRSVDAIIGAAREALTEDPAASAESIVARAGVHRATFYRHFPSRQALADAIYDRVLAEIADIHEQAAGAASPYAELEEIARRTIEVLERSRLFVYVAPRGASDPSTAALAENLRRLMGAAHEQGLVRRDEAPDALLAAYSAFVVGASIPPPSGFSAADKARTLMLMLRAPAA